MWQHHKLYKIRCFANEALFLHAFCGDQTNIYLLHGVQIGGSDVLVLPMTYIFNEEPVRWKNLLSTLGVEAKDAY